MQNALLQGDTDRAAQLMESAGDGLFHRAAKQELSALVLLFQGKFKEGDVALKKLGDSASELSYEKMLTFLAETGHYRALDHYADFLVRSAANSEAFYFKSLARTALLDPETSSQFMQRMPEVEKEKKRKALELLAETNGQLKKGRIDYVFGANGTPLAYYDLKRKKTVALAPGFDFSPFTEHFVRGIRYFKLTIDRNLQQKIHRLFTKYYGTFILLRLEDNGILASYSKSAGKHVANAALVEQFEPGSIVKVVTLFGYLRKRSKELFPFECKGNMTIDGELFYDWLPHRRVESYEHALAVSCNLAFGRMGISMGKSYLNQCFDDFYFNKQPFQDLFFQFPTGKYNTSASTDLRLARLAVGLKEVTTTTLHSALIAGIIAQGGSAFQPHLIDNIKNVLNLGFYQHQPQLLQVYKDDPAHHRAKQAMTAVQDYEDGTGRRARVDFMLTALKTGTAGDKKSGLDSILMGFFPAVKPQYAFAFRLQQAGKAQLEGAYFLKRFLEQSDLIPQK